VRYFCINMLDYYLVLLLKYILEQTSDRLGQYCDFKKADVISINSTILDFLCDQFNKRFSAAVLQSASKFDTEDKEAAKKWFAIQYLKNIFETRNIQKMLALLRDVLFRQACYEVSYEMNCAPHFAQISKIVMDLCVIVRESNLNLILSLASAANKNIKLRLSRRERPDRLNSFGLHVIGINTFYTQIESLLLSTGKLEKSDSIPVLDIELQRSMILHYLIGNQHNYFATLGLEALQLEREARRLEAIRVYPTM